ncbi:DUF1249 domain-containing protein [Colwellia sp. RSH04]|uniref:DUF1249 domain-containing protein n=1 Tax=Colwellia sp. RSH04 TaxID=2305464 RepID=UPI000E588BBE|nr:DUF1249 domain-containing protein [Colwellia sp. RSH04]RHW77650.1 DUF1249 domain-containing protein [Colwellia sp. RSH04]
MSFFLNKQKQRKYQPNLVSLMTLCSNNYMLLTKLLAGNDKLNEQRQFFINESLAYRIKIIEITRYTSVVTIEQQTIKAINNAKIANLFKPRMEIRLYHDARMAEVIKSQDVRQIKPRYDYPNRHMHQQDEKQQINQFLHDWLHLCLSMGQTLVELKK